MTITASNTNVIYKDGSGNLVGSNDFFYDGVSLKVKGNLESIYTNGDEGGEIFLNKATTNTTLTSGVTIDVNQNRLRIFETGGTNRGGYWDISTLAAGVGTNLLSGGSGSSGSSGTSGGGGATIANFGDNRIITSDGTTTGLNGEANLTFDGNTLRATANTTTVPLIIASGSSTQDLLRITQTGTGNAFVVEDSDNPDSTPFVINSSGRVKVGTSLDVSAANIHSISSVYGIESYGDLAGVYARGLTYGLIAEAISDRNLVAGIVASATNDELFFGVYYGALLSAYSSNNLNYSVRLQDGSQGLNKVLVDVTGDGSANWKSDLILTSIVASASSTGDIVRITQTGTGNALVVEDSANPDATPFIVHTTGNVGVGTASPGNNLHVQGSMKLTGTFSGNTTNFVQSELITQTVLLYMSNNT